MGITRCLTTIVLLNSPRQRPAASSGDPMLAQGTKWIDQDLRDLEWIDPEEGISRLMTHIWEEIEDREDGEQLNCKKRRTK